MSTKPFYSGLKSGTLIPVPKTTVLAAVPKILKMVEETRQGKREEDIEDAMENETVTVPTPWYRFSKTRPMNRADAEVWVDGFDEDGWPNSYWKSAGLYWENLAKALEASALLVEDGGDLLLNLESACLVQEWTDGEDKS